MSSLRNQPTSEDQRNVIIATVLVAVIMFVWMFYFGPTPAEQAGVAPDTTQSTAQQQTPPGDTGSSDAQPAPSASAASERETSPSSPSDDTQQADTQQADASQPERPSDAITGPASQGEARDLVVQTNKYTAVFSTKGATVKRFTLREYQEYSQEVPVQLIDSTMTQGSVGLAFTTPSNRLVDTRSLYFSSSVEGDTLRVTDEDRTLTFEVQLADGTLRQSYTFHPDDYDIGMTVEQTNPSSFRTADGYELIWEGGVPFSEGGKDAELTQSGVFAYSGGSLESLTLQSTDQTERNLNGAIDWVSLKNKYFAVALMPDDPSKARGADILGRKATDREGLASNSLTARLQMPAAGSQQQSDTFHFYVGPLYYYDLAAYERDLYQMVDYGWDYFEWITRPFAVWLFIPMLTYLGGYFPYGVVVILMAVFVKMLVYPLTKKSYRSMAKMRDLQPRMEEIKEEYGDDPQKQQEEMMKMYRETGVNPLGGCLPMVFQYPVIIALYQFIPQSIQLRQESFLWAQDLSAPDVILSLPFSIPFYGDYVAGFTLLMGLSMVLTMRLQTTPGASGTQQKVFMYAMPALIFVIFNQFASGLSLYYLFYNLVTAAQQKWIYYQLEQEEDEDDSPRKRSGRSNGQNGSAEPGFFQKLLKKAEEAQQQR